MLPTVFGRDFFDDFFDFPFFDDRDMQKAERKLYGHHGKNLMKTDVQESDTGYVLEMDLPGFKKEEIQVSLSDGYLTIRAEKGPEQDRNNRYIRRERYTGVCERSFYVGDYLTETDIRGEFKHGVLKLMIPKQNAKPAVEEKKYIAIEG